jgi:transcriptional regulator with XRE-family HTH domain
MAVRREEMRRRREQLGLTQEQVAEQLRVSVSSYRGWEAGTRTPRVGFRPRIARVLQVSLVEVHRWFETCAAPPDGVAVPAWLGTFAALEQGAAEVRSYQPVSVPGLLQTATYAAAVQRSDTVDGPISGVEVDRWVDHRLTRQEVLERTPDPLRLSVVIDESILYRVTGDGEIMHDQLLHLVAQAKRPTIDVRILPLDRATHVAAFGSFTLLTSPGAIEPYMTVVLDWVSAHYLELPTMVGAHTRLFRHLQEVARSPADSIDLIRDVAKERYE